jgi:hypothetical protein
MIEPGALLGITTRDNRSLCVTIGNFPTGVTRSLHASGVIILTERIGNIVYGVGNASHGYVSTALWKPAAKR